VFESSERGATVLVKGRGLGTVDSLEIESAIFPWSIATCRKGTCRNTGRERALSPPPPTPPQNTNVKRTDYYYGGGVPV
jgi:hypothetical protein